MGAFVGYYHRRHFLAVEMKLPTNPMDYILFAFSYAYYLVRMAHRQGVATHTRNAVLATIPMHRLPGFKNLDNVKQTMFTVRIDSEVSSNVETF